MTGCERARERVDAYVAGRLTADEAAELETHLTMCDACRRDEQAARALAPMIARLPREIEPPTDPWPAIRGRLHPRPRRARPLLLAAAIAASLLLAALGALRLTRRAARPLAVAPPPAPSFVAISAAGARTYAAADAEASADLQRRGAESRSPAASSLARHLRAVDQAIAESRAALAADPHNPDLAALLRGAYRQKLDLLLAASLPPRS